MLDCIVLASMSTSFLTHTYKNIMTDLQQKLYFYTISSYCIGLPLRPTTFCTTVLSYLKCKIIGISEYDRKLLYNNKNKKYTSPFTPVTKKCLRSLHFLQREYHIKIMCLFSIFLDFNKLPIEQRMRYFKELIVRQRRIETNMHHVYCMYRFPLFFLRDDCPCRVSVSLRVPKL